MMNDNPKLTIVALHGNGGGAFRFELVKPHISADVNFQAVTLPGFADALCDQALQSMRDYAFYVYRLVMSKPRPIVLLGHGIGGSIILEFIQHFPAEIEGIILHAPVGTRLESRLFPRIMALPGAFTLGQRLISARLLRPLFKRLLFSRPVPQVFLERFFDEYRQCSAFRQMFNLITPGWFRALRPVNLPAFLLWGERERVLKVDQAEDYQSLLPECRTRIIHDWDHFPMIEQPKEYASEIVKLAREMIQ